MKSGIGQSGTRLNLLSDDMDSDDGGLSISASVNDVTTNSHSESELTDKGLSLSF